jgi:hypothetical protein
MDTMPVIDSGNVAQVALTRILETASVPVTMRQGAECSRSLWTTGLWTGSRARRQNTVREKEHRILVAPSGALSVRPDHSSIR